MYILRGFYIVIRIIFTGNFYKFRLLSRPSFLFPWSKMSREKLRSVDQWKNKKNTLFWWAGSRSEHTCSAVRQWKAVSAQVAWTQPIWHVLTIEWLKDLCGYVRRLLDLVLRSGAGRGRGRTASAPRRHHRLNVANNRCWGASVVLHSLETLSVNHDWSKIALERLNSLHYLQIK